jgi:subtilisin family serine protease
LVAFIATASWGQAAKQSMPAYEAPTKSAPQAYVSGFDAMIKLADRGSKSVIITLNGNALGLIGPKSTAPASMDSDVNQLAAAQSKMADFLRGIGATEILAVQNSPIIGATVNADQLRKLSASGLVGFIEENIVVKPDLAQSINIIQAPGYWASYNHKGQSQIVAIIDTGVQSAHPFLAGRKHSEACVSTVNVSMGIVTAGCNSGFTGINTALGSGEPCIGTGCNHGTHVAGIAVGKQNGTPAINGVAPEAKYIGIQAFGKTSSGQISAHNIDLLNALGHVKTLKQAGAKIASVNMSLGGGAYITPCFGAMETMLASLVTLGVAPVISSGNNGYTNAVGYPGCSPSAITIGATNNANSITSYSNQSSQVDLMAPGGQAGSYVDGIESSVTGGAYASLYGTSMAAPHVAGAYVLLRQRFPCYPLPVIMSKLQATGIPVTRSGTLETFKLIQLNAASAQLSPLWKSYLCAKKYDPALDENIKANPL